MRHLILAAALAGLLCSAVVADARDEYDQRLKQLDDKDIDGIIKLGHFCCQNAMLTEGEALANRALKIDKTNKEAEKLLTIVKRMKDDAGLSGGSGSGSGRPTNPGGKPQKPPGDGGSDGPRGNHGGSGNGGMSPGGNGGVAPPNPGLPGKTPDQLGNDPQKIKAHVDALYAYGDFLNGRGERDAADTYWKEIERLYPGAADKIELIKAKRSASRARPSGGGDDGFERKDPSFDRDEGQGDAKGSDDRVPPRGGDDRVPPAGGDDKVPPKPGSEVVPPPTGENVPPISGSDKEKKDPKDVPSEDDDAKKIAAEAKKYAAAFKIKSFRIGANQTFNGTYPELQLTFECTDKPKLVTLKFYGYSKEGKVFKAERTFFGPDPNVTHKIVSAYKKEWVIEFGRLIAGRIELCAGGRKNNAVMLVQDCDADKTPKDWFKIEEPQDYMGFYGPKQNPFESNTLKRFSR